MPYERWAWSQIKNVTCQQVMQALERDGWERQDHKGRRGKKGASTVTYRHPDRPPGRNIVVIHPHPKKTMGAGLLKELLEGCIGWTEDDLVRLKLIKAKHRRKKE